MVRSDLPNFFMRKSYEEKYKQKFPDSLKDWYGKGKVITEGGHGRHHELACRIATGHVQYAAGRADLARWLLKWKLFSEDAKKCGFASQDNVKAVLRVGLEGRSCHELRERRPCSQGKAWVSIDTQMCVYAMWDDRGSATHAGHGKRQPHRNALSHQGDLHQGRQHDLRPAQSSTTSSIPAARIQRRAIG